MSEHQPFRDLTEDECWEMLRAQEFGRLAFHLLDEVHIVPINYAVDHDERLVFRTAEGSKLLGVTIDGSCAFEIDDYSEEHAASVIVRGTAAVLTGREADATDQLPLRPWVDTNKLNVVAITPDEISGRRFDLTRPWLHIRPPHEAP